MNSRAEFVLHRGRILRTPLARQGLSHSLTHSLRFTSLTRSLARSLLGHWLAVARVCAIVHVVREGERHAGRLVLTCR